MEESHWLKTINQSCLPSYYLAPTCSALLTWPRVSQSENVLVFIFFINFKVLTSNFTSYSISVITTLIVGTQPKEQRIKLFSFLLFKCCVVKFQIHSRVKFIPVLHLISRSSQVSTEKMNRDDSPDYSAPRQRRISPPRDRDLSPSPSARSSRGPAASRDRGGERSRSRSPASRYGETRDLR